MKHDAPVPAAQPGDLMKDGRGRKGRISPRVRLAVSLRVTKGYTGEEAAREAGLSQAGFWKAMKRPEVAALAESLKADYVQQIARLKEYAKLHAIEVGLKLMDEAQSEQVKARMVEFFAGEAKQALVNIDLSGAKKGAGGYVYQRPEAMPPDMASVAPDVEDAEIIDESE